MHNFAFLVRARIFVGLAVLVVVALSARPASAALPESQSTPEAVATEFYGWYVKTMATNRDPIADDPDVLGKFVSNALIAELRRAMATEDGLDTDYFIQAPDYLDEWLTNIRASKPRIRKGTATLELTLGAGPEAKQRLGLTMLQEKGIWKIRNVRPLQ
jgi:hypothetical protein